MSEKSTPVVYDKYVNPPIMVGVSTCLLGQKVRHDGGHKYHHYVKDILGNYFSLVPVCPELEVGMGVPREAVRLEGKPDAPRMIGTKSGRDWTAEMNSYSQKRVKKQDVATLCGYILKKKSPSCGMERVTLYSGKGAGKNGRGLYAAVLIAQYPLLPIEEEGRLNDAALRENFITRVFAYHRLRNLFKGRFSRGAIVDFHATNKYLIMAHSVEHYREMGRLVAEISKFQPAEFRGLYFAKFMEALSSKTTTKKNVNVMQHIFGFLKDRLDPEDKKYILGVIEDYRQELVPLIVPLTLLKHYVEKHDVAYIKNQIYLNPHPRELMLRNHI